MGTGFSNPSTNRRRRSQEQFAKQAKLLEVPAGTVKVHGDSLGYFNIGNLGPRLVKYNICWPKIKQIGDDRPGFV